MKPADELGWKLSCVQKKSLLQGVNLAARSVTEGASGGGALELGHPENNRTMTLPGEQYTAEIRRGSLKVT